MFWKKAIALYSDFFGFGADCSPNGNENMSRYKFIEPQGNTNYPNRTAKTEIFSREMRDTDSIAESI